MGTDMTHMLLQISYSGLWAKMILLFEILVAILKFIYLTSKNARAKEVIVLIIIEKRRSKSHRTVEVNWRSVDFYTKLDDEIRYHKCMFSLQKCFSEIC